MKDNPGPGGVLRGGKNGRKAWEIEEEATWGEMFLIWGQFFFA